MRADAETIAGHIRVGHPCVSIVTFEEHVALDAAREAATDLKRDFFVWDIAFGLYDGRVRDANGEKETHEPVKGLHAIGKKQGAVIALLDMRQHLTDAATLRMFREILSRCRERATAIVLIDHDGAGPAVVAAHAVEHELSLPGEKEIRRIIGGAVKALDRASTTGIQARLSPRELDTLIKNLQGLRRRHVELIVNEVVQQDNKLGLDDLNHILAAKRRILGEGGLLEFIETPATLDDIGGMSSLKRWLGARERALDPEAAEFGLPAPRGVLLLGVQGAGKSLCAKAVATAWGRPLLRMDPSSLYDRYIGSTEQRFRDALSQAEAMAPVILWIDEIEKGFASAASASNDGGVSRRVFGSLLTWMQDHRRPVFLVATANDIDSLPPELMRKGRFDEIFFVDLPGDEARRKIAAIHISKRDREPEDFDLAAISRATKGYSGAEIEQAIVSALHECFDKQTELTTEGIIAAAKGSPPLSVTRAEQVAELRRWAKSRCVPADEDHA